MTGDNHDRDRGESRLRAQTPADRVPVHAGHLGIQQHDGDVVSQRALESARAVVMDEGHKSRAAGSLGQQQPTEVLVIGNDRNRGKSVAGGALFGKARICELGTQPSARLHGIGLDATRLRSHTTPDTKENPEPI